MSFAAIRDAVRTAPAPVHTREQALLGFARALVSAAKLGYANPVWTLALVRGTLKLNATHSTDLNPLGMLLAASRSIESTEDAFDLERDLLSRPTQFVDPPTARDPPRWMLTSSVQLCHKYLYETAVGHSLSYRETREFYADLDKDLASLLPAP